MSNLHILTGAGDTIQKPTVLNVRSKDLIDSLSEGLDDFAQMPTHALFIALLYPLAGFVLAGFAFGYNMLPLLYPLAAGFAIMGPLVAVGLYEMSRRREHGLEVDWSHAFDAFKSPQIGAIIAVGVVQLVIYVVWVMAAQAIYQGLFGVLAPESWSDFLRQVFTTKEGWTLIVVGNIVGFVFAALALSIGAISFPLLLDRDIGAIAAIGTSLRVIARNPINMSLWGIIVAGLLLLGSLPALIGLAVIMPVLGHSTWHLYRRAVAR